MGNCSCIDRSAVVSWTDDADWDEYEWTAAGAGSKGRPAGKKGEELNHLKERLLARSPGRAEDPHHHGLSPPAAAAWAAAVDANADADSSNKTGSAANYEVKIKISKKQLEELLCKDGDAGLRQALEGLLGGTHGWDLEQVVREVSKADTTGHHHHWRPHLQTIPESEGTES